MIWFFLALAYADGGLEGVVFGEDGAPVAGVEVLIDGERHGTTDIDGGFTLTLGAGEHTVQAGTATAVVPVVDNEVTEVLLTLGGPAIVEAARPRAQTTESEVGTARLVGSVVDAAHEPIADARIYVRGFVTEGRTDTDGRFELALPAGAHDLSVLKSGYASQTLQDVEVPADGGTVIVELVEAGLTLSDFYVEVPRIEGGTTALVAERQNSSELVDTLSAEDMSRRGDSSAASALRRVTGLTIVGGKYVYVRGLGERYSASLLNGASLPSPEPERRVVPLDLFPTGMLDSVVVQKTYSPAMPGEFGGGVVDLRTRGVPEEPMFRFSLSGAYVHGTTFRPGPMADRGPTDWLGFDGGYRDLPDAVVAAGEESPIVQRDDLPRSTGYTPEELEVLGEAMPNRWGLGVGRALPNGAVSMVAGRGFDLGESQLGLLGGLTFSNGWQRDLQTTTWYAQSGDGLKELNQYDFDDLTNEVGLGGLVEISAELGSSHALRLTSLLTRSSESTARRYIGFNNDIGTDIRVQRTRWVERQLWAEQLSGVHRFDFLGKAGFEWRYGMSMALRLEPDRRDVLQQPSTQGGWTLRTQGGGNDIFYSRLDDVTHEVALDLVVPVAEVHEIRLGGVRTRRDRTVDTRRFGYELKSAGEAANNGFLTNEPEDVFTPQNIGVGALQFEETTQPTDNYTASQPIDAVFLQADLHLWLRSTLLGGVRWESSRQLVQTFQLFQPDLTPISADLETADWLPAATWTQPLTDEDAATTLQLRLGYGRTVSRPDFRELSPAVFNDVVGGREVAGNEDLRRAVIDNFDARLEWYIGGSESISIGAFHKHFTDPIETVVLVGAVSRTSFDNAEQASNTGVEVEWRVSAPRGVLDEVYLAGNAAFIRSRVDLGDAVGNQTSTMRPLQGQSPYVINLQVSYEGIDAPLSAAVLYNTFGPRIVEVGEGGLPDAIQLPTHQLDVVVGMQLGRGWTLKASGKNLLDARARTMLGDRPVTTRRAGVSAGLGISWSED